MPAEEGTGDEERLEMAQERAEREEEKEAEHHEGKCLERSNSHSDDMEQNDATPS